MDFTPSLTSKNFYRFTGPPENWLTAIKFMTWGLEEKHKERWSEIQPGDIFIIHSTGAGNSLFKNAKSGIIGLGVVGSNFSIKNNYLWIHEFKDKINRWPLLVPFSEIYLFSQLPATHWNAPNLDNIEETKILIDKLLTNYLPLSTIKGFPQMGSFSSISSEVSKQILYDNRPLYRYANLATNLDISSSKSTKLKPISSAQESLRYAENLEIFDTIETRVVNDAPSVYTKNNELLSRAEYSHSNILQKLIDLFKQKGYVTLSNKFVDLYAHNEEKSFLFEVKSTENKNFRSQARKGIIQLYEYSYFEIDKYKKENKTKFKDEYKILIPSKKPNDEKYVQFVNSLEVGIGVVEEKAIYPVGKDFGFSKF